MDHIREIVSNNLINLRKASGLTQVELAKKINYSDKAISRWEKGEVLPDLETIYALSEIYDVDTSAILKKPKLQDNTINKKLIKQNLLSQIFLICEIWLILSFVFTYIHITKQISIWQIFVWGIPATSIILIIFNKKNQTNISSFIYGTILIWSLIVCFYLHLIDSNPWYMFFIGIPLQGLIIIRYLFNYKQSNIIKFKNKKKSK